MPVSLVPARVAVLVAPASSTTPPLRCSPTAPAAPPQLRRSSARARTAVIAAATDGWSREKLRTRAPAASPTPPVNDVDALLLAKGVRTAAAGSAFASASTLATALTTLQTILAIQDDELVELLREDRGPELADLPAAALTQRLCELKAALPPASDAVAFVLSEPGLLLLEGGAPLGARTRRAMRALSRFAPDAPALAAEAPGTFANVLVEYLETDSLRSVHPFLLNWLQGCLGVR